MRLTLTSRNVGYAYTVAVVVLLGVHLLSWAFAAAGYPYQLGLRAKVDFETEASVPAMFAALSLLMCGLLLAVIGLDRRRAGETAWRWLLLACVFVFVAIDEAVGIHERVHHLMSRSIKLDGVFSIMWVLPYGAAALAGLALYAPWLRGLPSPTRRRFLLAAVLFLGGAIGMEMVSAKLYEAGLHESHWFKLEVTIEELLEFAGVGVFLCGLVDYLRQRGTRVTLGFADDADAVSD